MQISWTTMHFFHPTPLVVLVGFQSVLCVLAHIEGAAHAEGAAHTDGFANNTINPPEVADFNDNLYAACKLSPSSKLTEDHPKVYGQVLFKQGYPGGTLKVLVHARGLPESSQPRAIHIHQYGDLSDGCDSTGGHYNPSGVSHATHPGDFGNFVALQGKIHKEFDSEATLYGGLSVLGRAMVLHEGEDDLGLGGDAGSLLHGNSGLRLACCVIGMSTPNLWNKHYQRQRRSSSRRARVAGLMRPTP